MESRWVCTTNSSLFSLPASSATNVVGCWEAQASRFPAVRQPIWKGAKSLAPRLPNFQATWRAARRADGKPGRPWELLIPSIQILSGLGYLSGSNLPEHPGNHSPNQHALNGDATLASTRAPCSPPSTENRSGSSFTEASERSGFSSMLGGESGFGFFKWLNHSKLALPFFFFFVQSLIILRSIQTISTELDLLNRLQNKLCCAGPLILMDQRG